MRCMWGKVKINYLVALTVINLLNSEIRLVAINQ